MSVPELGRRACCESCRSKIDFAALVKMGGCYMILCQNCGNKRCPKAVDHRNKCTGSNDVGQVVNMLGIEMRVVEVLEPHPSNLMPWICCADKACDACPQRGDGVCCGGVV